MQINSYLNTPFYCVSLFPQNCGGVVNWKRVQGANGKLQGKKNDFFNLSNFVFNFVAFGFCEYENPEGTLRCIRLLNGWQIQDKKLVVSDLFISNFFFFWIIKHQTFTPNT